VWDVVHSCRRAGSLDAAIEPPSVRTNDFKSFFASHPAIDLVCFNGATAEQLYARRVQGADGVPAIARQRLPSTSPAHAARSFDDKLAAWRAALDSVLRAGPPRNRRAARTTAAESY
jgi:hypoxanthine-DNA glycosylase